MNINPQDAISQDALEYAPDAVIILGNSGLIEVVNEQTERLFGYARDELLGYEIEILVPERLRAGHAHVRDNFQANPATRPMGIGLELFGRRKDGSEFPVEISLSPMGIQNRRRVICLVRDVSEQKHIRAERRGALEERHTHDEAAIENLRASNTAKDEFVSMVSHELRNPLTTILGNARLLIGRPGLAEEAKLEALKDIEREGLRLQTTIEDLMMLARPESSEPLPTEPVSVHTLIETLVQHVSQQLPARTIRVNVEPGLVALGYPAYVDHVLLNLIGNAAKYSAPNEPIEIEARAQSNGSAIEVAVLDRGPGVKKEDADAIFSLFYRAHSTVGMASGMGIGLSVCKRLIEKQGGRIWVEERPGGGAAFRFVLPKCPE
jgi:PAS domain S-box-containing protein